MRDFSNSENAVALINRRRNSRLTLIVSFVCAVGITACLFAVYLYLRKSHAERLLSAQPAQAKSTVVPEAQIAQDEPRLNGGQAIIAGTVRNISPQQLTDLSIDLELKRRTDGSSEIQSVNVTPADLAVEQEGKFLLSVPAKVYTGVRVVQLRSGARSSSSTVAFKTIAGAPRPLERTPQRSKPVIVERSAPRRNGDDFLNTPETPIAVH